MVVAVTVDVVADARVPRTFTNEPGVRFPKNVVALSVVPLTMYCVFADVTIEITAFGLCHPPVH